MSKTKLQLEQEVKKLKMEAEINNALIKEFEDAPSLLSRILGIESNTRTQIADLLKDCNALTGRSMRATYND